MLQFTETTKYMYLVYFHIISITVMPESGHSFHRHCLYAFVKQELLQNTHSMDKIHSVFFTFLISFVFFCSKLFIQSFAYKTNLMKAV